MKIPTAASPSENQAFYAAALAGLRALDARDRSPRRLGEEAKLRWRQFAGALGHADRIDLLLRDASGIWGAAFSPAQAFGSAGLTSDEAFGPDWPSLDEDLARLWLSEIPPQPPTLDELATLLSISPQEPLALPPLSPATRIIVAGGAAILATSRAFQRDSSLSFSAQVVAVANRPTYRQLTGLAAIVIGSDRPALLLRSSDSPERLRSFGHPDIAIVSEDAEPEAAAFAHGIVGG